MKASLTKEAVITYIASSLRASFVVLAGDGPGVIIPRDIMDAMADSLARNASAALWLAIETCRDA